MLGLKLSSTPVPMANWPATLAIAKRVCARTCALSALTTREANDARIILSGSRTPRKTRPSDPKHLPTYRLSPRYLNEACALTHATYIPYGGRSTLREFGPQEFFRE